MKLTQHTIALETRAAVEATDLTPRLRELVTESGARSGYVIVASRHTTCGIAVNENEPRLIDDIKETLARLVPALAEYRHNDIEARGLPDEPRNAHAHIAAMLLGNSATVPIAGGALALGTWQSVLFFELDGPRSRTVSVQIGGDR